MQFGLCCDYSINFNEGKKGCIKTKETVKLAVINVNCWSVGGMQVTSFVLFLQSMVKVINDYKYIVCIYIFFTTQIL